MSLERFVIDLADEATDADDVLRTAANAVHVMLALELSSTLDAGQRIIVARAADALDLIADELVAATIADHHGGDEAWGDDDTEGR